MKKSFKIFAVLFIAYFTLNTTIKSVANAAIEKATITLEQENKLLWDYYYASENLLDTLETKYQWVDAVESYEYYDAVEALYDNNLIIN
jgi:hypothetical protein